MIIKISASTNFKNGKWSGVKNHVERNYLHSRNKGINPELSALNINISQANAKTLIKNHFQKFVRIHDKKVKLQGHKKRMYGSVDKYIHRRKGSPTTNVVLKLGTIDDKKKLEKRFGIKKIKQADNLGFSIYASNFNKRHKYFKMAEAITNVDEKGADHMHYSLVCLGKTKRDKPSMGLNSALRCEYHTHNRILAMKLFHTQEDPYLIKCMNQAYQKDLNPNIKLKLTRTGTPHHLSEKVFENSENKKHRLDKASRKQNNRINKIQPRIKESKHQVKESNKDSIRNTKNSTKEIQKIIKQIQKSIKATEQYCRKLVKQINKKRLEMKNSHHISL